MYTSSHSFPIETVSQIVGISSVIALSLDLYRRFETRWTIGIHDHDNDDNNHYDDNYHYNKENIADQRYEVVKWYSYSIVMYFLSRPSYN